MPVNSCPKTLEEIVPGSYWKNLRNGYTLKVLVKDYEKNEITYAEGGVKVCPPMAFRAFCWLFTEIPNPDWKPEVRALTFVLRRGRYVEKVMAEMMDAEAERDQVKDRIVNFQNYKERDLIL